MADEIRIGNYSVSSFKVGVDDCSIYLGDVKLYPQGGYDLCYDVVYDISDYQGSFADVFEKSTDTWYKLNNLGEYEEYGIYGSGRNITTYKGKLTIDGDHEYEWNGSSWVDLGEVTGSTATLPDVPFTVNINAKNYDASTKTFAKTDGQLANTDITITAGTPTLHGDYVTVASGTKGVINGYGTYFNRTNSAPTLTIISKQKTNGSDCHLFANRDGYYNWMYRPTSTKLNFHGSSQIAGTNTTTQPVIESVRVDSNRLLTFNNYTDNTTASSSNFSYGNTNGTVALFAGYVSTGSEWFVGDFYWLYMSQTTLTDAQVQQVIAYNEGGGQSEYPKYYSDKADPLDNLTFNTLAEAETYAMSNCVYDGMKATIGGSKYAFDSVNGWTLIPEYYKVEDVTPSSQGGSGWTITGSATYNPDLTYYDDFSVENANTTFITKIAKVTIYGYENFTYYLRGYGYATYAYAYATNVDELSSDPTTNFGYTSNSAITNTYNWNKAAGSAVNLSNYRRITYNNLDKTVEHTFYVIFYGRKYSSSSNVGNGTILIPKEQTNENFEQVTFSASTNINASQKNLYIDGNNSTSGGTNYFYYRWIVGLPAGSHTSYTDYSNISYCPTTSSATFASVAGNSRQVDYIYQTNPTTGIIVRLVDGDGNVLTPPVNSVRYNVYKYNPCGTSTFSNYYLPGTVTGLYVGGIFKFGYYNNQQYIYGYQPPSVGTTYNVDDYNTFDLVYTELDKEAVTITYTTYDPNDAETPTFNTDVTWPYSGGTTSSTTLTSFDVPYTYEYTVDQTSNLFSANTQTYTAGQASRTITLLLYPNNREFQTVADMEAYQYSWEGMVAKVGSTNYKYENSQWVEIVYNVYEYIASEDTTSTRYYDFNTNFYPTKSHTIEVKFTMTKSIDWGKILGWKSSGGDNTAFQFNTVTANYQVIVRKGGSEGTANRPTIGSGVTTTYTLPLNDNNRGSYTIEGSTPVSFDYNSNATTLPSTTPLHLFSDTLSDRGGASGKMYYVRVYDENNNLVKEYLPSDYNGTPCFYETVDGDYILNTYSGSNAGTCTLGNPI